jgi:hypothetical protein
VLEVSQTVVERAGEYADALALRGYDSVQLAAAFEAGRITETTIEFACFDVLKQSRQGVGDGCRFREFGTCSHGTLRKDFA